jgi:hypothetical protein
MHLIDAYQAAVKEANEKVPEFQDLNPGPAHDRWLVVFDESFARHLKLFDKQKISE